ncbi:YqzL family protein [Romboutsia weinsteinii]|uniref:YqzL family protein n=1 Tax=Romboutsia weinsteinii TaxID=2020949 RepID=A0A371JAD1_9FIRM|nr:YqzL family protein [Romboutsia weinsteinii]RDY29729.1 YqzL family protein [Romboutsia weinsteinii]
MNNLCWEVFKKTGSIEAYLYLRDCKNLDTEIEDIREIDNDHDNAEYPGDST